MVCSCPLPTVGALRAEPVPSALALWALPYPPRPEHRGAWNGLRILSGLMSRLWPGVRAQGLCRSPHLL